MKNKKNRNFYALLYPNRNFTDSLELIREWDTARLLRFASKKERDAAITADCRIVAVDKKTAQYIAYNNLRGYFWGDEE